MFVLHLLWGIIPAILLSAIGTIISFEKRGVFLIKSGSITRFYTLSTLTVLIFLSFTYLIFSAFRQFKKKYPQEIRAIVIVCVLSFPLTLVGPFFQPPSDPIFHADLLWDSMEANIFDYGNRAYINKAIFATVLEFIDLDFWFSRLNAILIFHCITTLLLILSAYSSSRLYGLSPKWSFFSLILMILFFGTDRFSYFTYYSLAPSSINMSFYWLLSALFFNGILRPNKITSEEFWKVFLLFLIGLLLLPILFYSHIQEVGFLFYTYMFSFIFLSFRISESKELNIIRKYFWIPFLILIFFFPFAFGKIYSKMSVFSKMSIEKDYSLFTDYWVSLIFGKWNGHRIFDTLGIMGFMPLVFIVFYLLLYKFHILHTGKEAKKFFLGMLPGVIPFLILLVPLNMIIWIKSVNNPELTWRLTYMSQFWISIAYFFSMLEPLFSVHLMKLIRHLEKFFLKISNWAKRNPL